jgi:hypothetical protein
MPILDRLVSRPATVQVSDYWETDSYATKSAMVFCGAYYSPSGEFANQTRAFLFVVVSLIA